MDLDEERQRISRISRRFSQAMEEISGMNVPEQNRGLKIFGSAMEEGNASFTLDEGKDGGTLSVLGETIRINNPDEASLYDGIQQKANKSKKVG